MQADCSLMRTRVAFEDVLDATLRESAPVNREQTWPTRTGTAATYGFFFGTGSLAAGIRQDAASSTLRPALDVRFAGAVSSPSADPRPSTTPFTADAAPRPRRRLAAPQQRALDELVTLGARLTADFTAAELRSAFRALARQYHPDRHTGVAEIERATLARQFARVHDAYRLLSES